MVLRNDRGTYPDLRAAYPKADSSIILGCIDERRAAVLQVLRIDQVTVEVDAALRAEGIEPILLKGPALESWTAPEHRPRPYTDTDLLVDPAHRDAAGEVLEGMGFRPAMQLHDVAGRRSVALPWRREDGANLDLHWSIVGMEQPPERVWEILSANTEPIVVGGRGMRCLSGGARALHVALHAVQQGEGLRHERRDLDDALRLAPREAWERAAAVAAEVGALETFAAALRTHPVGTEYADAMDLPTRLPIDLLLRQNPELPMSLGFESLARLPSWRARLRLAIWGKLIPSPGFMRLWAPRLAVRGPLGLAAAYVMRVPWLLFHAPRALVNWLRVRRVSARSG